MHESMNIEEEAERIKRAAKELGRRGGAMTSGSKAAAARDNGAKGGRPRVFTEDQIRSLLVIASADWKTAILVSWYTGMRLGDIVPMKWESIHFSERGCTIDIPGRQSFARNTDGLLPVHPELEKHLSEIRGSATENLCPSFLGQPIHTLSREFRALLAAAKIERMKVSENRFFSRYSFHSLRGSFCERSAKPGATRL